jgi:hypothetical protein
MRTVQVVVSPLVVVAVLVVVESMFFAVVVSVQGLATVHRLELAEPIVTVPEATPFCPTLAVSVYPLPAAESFTVTTLVLVTVAVLLD